jgi:hypothetical protein
MGEKLPRRKTFVRVRKFLNRPGFHSTAVVLAEIRREKQWISSTLEISDCSRKISLAIDTHGKRNVDNTLRKLDLLADTIAQVRAGILAAVDECEIWRSQHPKKNSSVE